jgi:hypothetical protein
MAGLTANLKSAGQPPVPGTEEATMYPYIAQNLAAERARDLREQAAAARRATEARRARRAGWSVPSGRSHARRPGAPRWA